jgi:hypothetical protein
MKTRVILLMMSMVLSSALAVAQNVRLTGTITQWREGKESALPEAKVIIGTGIWLDARGTTDVVRNAKGIVAEVSTDARGNFTAQVPAGKYTVILWKGRYVPSTQDDVAAPGDFKGSISPDHQVASGGRHESLSKKD